MPERIRLLVRSALGTGGDFSTCRKSIAQLVDTVPSPVLRNDVLRRQGQQVSGLVVQGRLGPAQQDHTATFDDLPVRRGQDKKTLKA